MKKRLIILGSTGSIGAKTLDVVRDFNDRFEVVALSSHTQTELLARQNSEFQPQALCVSCSDKIPEGALAAQATGAAFYPGEAGLCRLIDEVPADLVVVATVGFVGLMPTLHALRRGMTVALANKEVLVTAGEIVMEEARKNGVRILPIDSEHNAIFQCLNGSYSRSVHRLILTASGGPFRGYSRERMQAITPADALRHPTWTMGPKITIDSATLMNKGFEVIEAAHLFDMPAEKVSVVVHPQSVIHSMIEYADGSIIAQLGATDMYLPIQNVLLHPERLENRFPSLDFAALATLTFEEPQLDCFPCLRYAYQAAEKGGIYPAVLNAANEIAVARFLADDIPFLMIPEIIDNCLQAATATAHPSLEDIQAANNWSRQRAADYKKAKG